MTLSKILCPLDLSDFSRRALEHAMVLARWYGADVVALHVFATWLPPGNASTYPSWVRMVPEVREQVDRELRDQLKPVVAAGMEVPLVTRDGDPVAEILAEARKTGADLIVLSTHGRSGFDRLTLGSVTEKVLRKAKCPVLVVPAHGPEAGGASLPFTGYRRVICAVDFSDSSDEALRFAASLAERGRPTVTLVHVVEVADNADARMDDGSPLAALRTERVEQAQERLVKFASERLGPEVESEVLVRLGSAHRELLSVATETQADLVVMGVRGRGAVDMTLFGSTTNQVVRRAPCDVLTVRTR